MKKYDEEVRQQYRIRIKEMVSCKVESKPYPRSFWQFILGKPRMYAKKVQLIFCTDSEDVIHKGQLFIANGLTYIITSTAASFASAETSFHAYERDTDTSGVLPICMGTFDLTGYHILITGNAYQSINRVATTP